MRVGSEPAGRARRRSRGDDQPSGCVGSLHARTCRLGGGRTGGPGASLLLPRTSLRCQASRGRLMSTDGAAGAIVEPHSRHLAATVLRRTAAFVVGLLVTFVGLTAVTFFISRMTKIDPVLAVVGDKATKAAYDNAYKALGLDQSVFVQYGIYLRRLVSGDFGMSVLTSRPVLSDLIRVFPATFELATIATIIGVLVGVPAGLLAAARKGRWPDHVIRVAG